MTETAKNAGVSLQIEQASLELAAGTSGSLPIKLVNQTGLLAEFKLMLVGLPREWYHFSATNLSLFPNWNETATLEIDIPATASPAHYRLRLIVTSTTDQAVHNEVQFELNVMAFSNAATPVTVEPGLPQSDYLNYNSGVLDISALDMAAPAPPESAPLPTLETNFPPADTATTMSWLFATRPEEPPDDGALTEEPGQMLVAGPVELQLENSRIELLPDQEHTQTVKLTNRGIASGSFELRLQGWPPDWYQLNPTSCTLFPNWSETFTLTVKLPAETEAGHPYPGQLLVTTGGRQPEGGQADLTVEITPPAQPASPASGVINPATPPVADPTAYYSGQLVPPGYPAQPQPNGSGNLPPANGGYPGYPAQPYYGYSQPMYYPMPPQQAQPARKGFWQRLTGKSEVAAQPQPYYYPVYPMQQPAPPYIPPAQLAAPQTMPPAAPIADAGEPTQALPPVQPAPIQPQPTQTVRLNEPAIKPAQPTQTVRLSEPLPAIKPAQPTQTVRLSEPIAPIKPAEPTQTVKLSEPATVISPDRSVETIAPPEPATFQTVPLTRPEAAESVAPISTTQAALPDTTTTVSAPQDLEVNAESKPEPATEPVSTSYSSALQWLNLSTPFTEETLPPLEAKPAAPVAPQDQSRTVENDQLRLKLEKATLKVPAGGFIEQQFSLVNLGQAAEVFDLRLEGLPLDWGQFSSTSVYLFPNWTESLYFRVDVPAETRPDKEYKARIFVTSHSQPGVVHNEIDLTVTTLPPEKPVSGELPEEIAGEIELSAEQPKITVIAGNIFEQQLKLSNQTGLVGTFDVALEGIPEDWYSFSCTFMTLFPGWSEEFYLRVQVPSYVQTEAFPIKVHARPRAEHHLPADLDLELDVQAMLSSSADLWQKLNNGEATEASFTEVPDSGEFVSFKSGDLLPYQERSSLAGLFPTAPTPTPNPGETTALTPSQALAAPNQSLTAMSEQTANAPVAPAAVNQPAQPHQNWWQRLTGGNHKTQTPPPAQPYSQPAPYMAAPVNYAPVEVAPTPATAPSAVAQPEAVAVAQPQATQLSVTDLFKSPASTATGSPANRPGGAASNLKVQIKLDRPHLTIVAGDSVEQPFELANLSALPDDFELSIEGLPVNWYKFSSQTVNLFPNWSQPLNLGISLSAKVKPSTYTGKIIAVSKTQPGVRTETPLSIEVLAPLKVEGRLQPRRARGYEAKYNLIVRNSSMSEGMMTLALAATNEYCQAEFNPHQFVIAPGTTQIVPVEVSLRPKTPSDQARQQQPFQIEITPQWSVGDQLMHTPPVQVEGEYLHEGRWQFLLRHPRLLFTGLGLIVLVLLWIFVITPLIRGAVWTGVDNYRFDGSLPDPKTPSIFIQDQDLAATIRKSNPFASFMQLEVHFKEEGQEIEVSLKPPVVNLGITMRGHLDVDEQGNLKFTMIKPTDPNTIPWGFAPPDQLAQHVSKPLRTWITKTAPNTKISKVEIEGTTLFIRLASCKTTEPACNVLS